MLAARRTVRVMGRTEILIVSISTRAGFNHIGAPPGKRLAVTFFGFFEIPERIRDSHRGSPRATVNIR